MSPEVEVVERTLSKDRTPESIVKLSLNEAHICGNLDCRTVSNCNDTCPGCTSQTSTLASIVENPVNSLAHEIAREAAMVELDSYTAQIEIEGVEWCDLETDASEQEREIVTRAARYLEAVGLLIRNANNPTLVRWE
jgi:hypothetical protein